ncbi:hypothetical protein Q7P37_011610 [Cladosporium fusiforme]
MALVPYQPRGRMIGRRRPPYSRTISLHDHILQAYLPYFATNHFNTNSDVDLILDAWLRSNASILDPSHHFPFRERDFREALYYILDAIEYAENYGQSTSDVAHRLLEELEEDWEEDMRVGGTSCQRRFRALAELSTASMSLAVGSVLRTFILGWVDEIAEEDDIESLAAWCWGISRSYMDLRDKEECLTAIIESRPDVIDELNERGADWVLRPVLNASTMTWPRRRRKTGRLRWGRFDDREVERLMNNGDILGRRPRDRDKLVDLVLRSRLPDSPVRLPRLIDDRYARDRRRRRLGDRIQLLPVRVRSSSRGSPVRRIRSPIRRSQVERLLLNK